LALLFCSFSALYAANSRNITLCIQGTGQPDFVQGFKEALVIEAKAAGYDITENMTQAKYIIRFTVEFDQTQQRSKFIVSLIKVVDSSVIVSMEYLFADEEEMLLYSQLVFFMLISNLPDNETAPTETVNDDWRNKWFYLSPSYNYSLMFMALQPDGLIGGAGVYTGDFDSPTAVGPLDNKIITMQGFGLGAEIQFLNFMSVEAGAQISMEEIVKNHLMYNVLFSAKLKFPLKFLKTVVFEPYGIGAYPMRFPSEEEVFAVYPKYVFGGGMQIAVKAGNSGAIFFDVNYLYFGKTAMKNHLTELYPKPSVIYYEHSVLGFAVGYKFGIGNRKRSDH
jgi:hypothetical protein